MSTLKEAVKDFLSQKRIAVAGVSGTRDIQANRIYRKFCEAGYQVFAVNPKAETVEGDPCYPDLISIPGGVDGVVIVTRSDVTEKIARQCVEAQVLGCGCTARTDYWAPASLKPQFDSAAKTVSLSSPEPVR